MRISDYIEQSFSNLWKKKLRTALTIFGIMIGIGALVSMIAFGKGVQKNITDTFRELELFNYVFVYPRSEDSQVDQSSQEPNTPEKVSLQFRLLDDDFLKEVTKIKGVEWAVPEVRFPAMIRFRQSEEFSLIQVLPADICQSGLIRLRAGRFYTSDDENALIISDSLLRRMKIKEPQSVIGQEIELSTMAVDFSLSNLSNIISFFRGRGLPFSKQNYTFTIAGVTERKGGIGGMPLRSDVFIDRSASEQMKKLSLTSIWDFFQSPQQAEGYSVVNIKLSSIKYIEPVKAKMEDWGLKSFALIDRGEEFKKGFLFMDMFLFAVGMIAVVVASMGIINTMVMSILERYKEIGIMKAVGASDRDVKKIFLFESGTIGFLGGVLGLILGWLVSMIINQIVNYYIAKQGVPYMDYFSFRWWLVSGAIVFSILISLAAGVYPTMRAARVDPVVALRHD
jgi:putative ABC transport system permease protein